MRQIIRIGIVLLLPFFLIAGSQEEALELPLAVTNFQQTEGGTSFTLENESDRDITAWSLKIVTTFEDGSEQVGGLIQDFAISTPTSAAGEAHLVHREGPLVPNQGHTNRLPPSSLPVREVRIDVMAVIYRDRSYEGDPIEIKEIFNKRRSQILAQSYWLDQMHRALDTPSEKDLRRACNNVKNRLFEGSDHYGISPRVSSKHEGARIIEKALSEDLDFALSKRSRSLGLHRALQEFVTDLEESYRTMRSHVSPDFKGYLKRQKAQ